MGESEITMCRSDGVNKHFIAVQNRKDCHVGKVLAMEFRDDGSVLMQSWHLIFLSFSFLPIK